MDIKEIKTQGFERVVHGYHEESNFSAYIAIHTLKNGPAFGGIRYFDYKDNERPYLDVQKLAEAMNDLDKNLKAVKAVNLKVVKNREVVKRRLF